MTFLIVAVGDLSSLSEIEKTDGTMPADVLDQ